jgi:ABC-type nitrate/sulfonate/bicarbonate transport system substrate-binding protein
MNRHASSLLKLALVLLALAVVGPARAANTPLTVVIFSAPSLGAFLPQVIKQNKFDQANGLDVSFPERTPDAYASQFNAGDFDLGGSAAVLTVGLADNRGVKVSYLFNLFDYWGAVVTQRPAIKSLADLKGKQLAAAKGTTNYAMYEFFARRAGLDTASVSVINTATPGLVGYALADRADAVQLWEPAYSLLLAKKPDIRTLDLDIAGQWKSFGGGAHIPYLGVAAHTDWVEKHPAETLALYKSYRAAAQWVSANPGPAAAIIAGTQASDADRHAIETLIRDNRRLGMDVAPAVRLKSDILSVYRVGKSIGQLNADPSAQTIYAKDMQ